MKNIYEIYTDAKASYETKIMAYIKNNTNENKFKMLRERECYTNICMIVLEHLLEEDSDILKRMKEH